jgi:hypothetical protein
MSNVGAQAIRVRGIEAVRRDRTPTRRRRPAPVLAALALPALACAGMSRYDKAATQFGASAQASVAAMQGVVAASQETCRARAWFHAVSDRFERPRFERGTDPLSLSSNVPRPDGKGTFTWKEHCDRLADYDKALQNALSALDAYASGLKDAATGDVAIGTDLTASVAGDAAEVAKALGASGFAKAQELSGPVTALANVALDVLRTRKVRDAVRSGKEPVSLVLRKAAEYVGAAREQVRDARRTSEELVRQADLVIPVWDGRSAIPESLPGQALALYEFSRIETGRLDALDAKLAATSQLLDELERAHAGLAAGAEKRSTDEDVQRFVGEKAQAIVKQLGILRSTAR